MPLFKCSNKECEALENTALGHYWYQSSHDEPVLCSECGPDKKWHGQFPKETPEHAGLIEGDDGFYYAPSEIAPGGYFYPRVKPKEKK